MQTTTPPLPALASLSLATLMSSLGTSIANVALPSMTQTLHTTFPQTQWVILSYLLALTSVIVSVGKLGDLFGHRRLLLLGITLFTLASILCALANTLALLLAARTLQGTGAALMMAMSMAILANTIAKNKTGSAMGALGTMSALGTALGPMLGGLLIANSGWRTIFWLNLPLGLLTLLLASRYLPATPARAKTDRSKLDIPGNLLLIATLTAYALALSTAHGTPDWENLALLLLAAGGVWLFVHMQARTAQQAQAGGPAPLIDTALLKQATRQASLIMSTLVATVMMGTLVVGPFYLAQALGLSASQLGLALSLGPIMAALTGLPAGRLVDRFGATRITFTGLTGMLLACLLLAFLPLSLGIAGYLAPIALATTSYALFQTANNTAVMADIAATQRGVMSGLLNLSRNLGLISGAALMGALFALGTGDNILHAQPAALANGMHLTFTFAAMLCTGALLLMLRKN